MKTLIIIASLFAFTTYLSAQDNAQATDTAEVSRNIRIEKEYVPEINKTKRLNLEYSVQEPSVTKSDIVYSNYVARVAPKSNFYPLQAKKQNVLKRKKDKSGYAAVGFGYPFSWMIEGYYPVLNSTDHVLELFAQNDAIMNIIKGDKSIIDTRFDADYKYKLDRSTELFANITYRNNNFSYYGEDQFDSIHSSESHIYNIGNYTTSGDSLIYKAQTIHRVGATAGIRTISTKHNINYHANLDYDFLYVQGVRAHEHILNLAGGIDRQINQHNIAIDAQLNAALYGQPRKKQNDKYENNVVLGLLPAYNTSLENIGLDLHIGAKLYFSFIHGRVVNATPDVMATYRLGRILSLYAGITGDYQINTLSNAFDECRYFDPFGQLTRNTYIPADFKLGADVTPIPGLSVGADLSYQFIYDQHLYLNKWYNCIQNENGTANVEMMSNYFTAEYANLQKLTVSAHVAYNYKQLFTFQLDGRYNGYYNIRNKAATDTLGAWNLPVAEINFRTELKPLKELSAYVDFYYGTGYKTLLDGNNIVKMKDHIDLNLGAAYTIESQYTVFLRLNNLLAASKKFVYQDWYGYDNIGFSFILGCKISF